MKSARRQLVPEGDTLHRIARRLGQALGGREILRFESPEPALERLCNLGYTVQQVEARGKHLLIYFDDGNILHTHLRREGSWRLYRAGESSKAGSRTVAVLAAAEWEAVCYGAPTAEVLTEWSLKSHPALSCLGPDLLAESFRLDEMLARLRRAPKQSIGVALLDQRNCAGIGNVYKSEVLFMESVHPMIRVESLSDQRLVAILRCARKWLLRNLSAGRRRTRWGPGPGCWVYRREGQRCLRCDATVSMLRQGPKRRSTYFCPRCQLTANASGGATVPSSTS
jgi:endonuclease VIII